MKEKSLRWYFWLRVEGLQAHIRYRFSHKHLDAGGHAPGGRAKTRLNEYGYAYWWYCCHRSHKWNLPCWRWFHWDGYCLKHTRSCFDSCEEE